MSFAEPGYITQLDSTVESGRDQSVCVSWLYNSICCIILVSLPTVWLGRAPLAFIGQVDPLEILAGIYNDMSKRTSFASMHSMYPYLDFLKSFYSHCL